MDQLAVVEMQDDVLLLVVDLQDPRLRLSLEHCEQIRDREAVAVTDETVLRDLQIGDVGARQGGAGALSIGLTIDAAPQVSDQAPHAGGEPAVADVLDLLIATVDGLDGEFQQGCGSLDLLHEAG